MNDLEVKPQMSSLLDAEAQKKVQDVQAALVIAQKFPRDETRAITKIITACKRATLAEKAMYAYPRAGELITGPSIRLAETMAQSWGNFEAGVRELEQRDGFSICEAYAWDLESNSKSSIQFTVKHVIDTKKGRKTLTDARDIYELVANYGARRKRACILALVPPDVVEAAVSQVRETLTIGAGEPIEDRIKKMVLAFKEQQVSQEMIEKRLGHAVKDCSADELVELSGIYTSLRDNVAKRGDFFEVGVQGEGEAAEITERFKGKGGKAKTLPESEKPGEETK